MLIQWVPLSSHFNTGCIAKTNTWFGGKKKHSIWIICMAESIANYDPGGNGEKNTLRCTLSISKVSSTEAGAPFRIGIHWKYCSFYESDEASRFRAPWNVSLDADCSIRSNWRRSILRLFVCFFLPCQCFWRTRVKPWSIAFALRKFPKGEDSFHWFRFVSRPSDGNPRTR